MEPEREENAILGVFTLEAENVLAVKEVCETIEVATKAPLKSVE